MDTGASHSFISLAFASSLELWFHHLDTPLFVNTLVGGTVRLDQVCCRHILMIVDQHLSVDLIVMPNLGFDVTLDIDWLSEYRAYIDSFKRQVTLFTPDGKSFRFKGDHLDFPTPSLSHHGEMI